ncbi:hypothetical protein MH215_10195 [Paenibacillus sp. ACRSA]|uniref:hypothetical protein n=1 Tax=Paenibacillus sp. ACRSA TaxID=2918211 RepID=UPI001EF6F7A9|nr:hypothetical protein [Paenibacillus sp. ACRSA]MCG7377366.1 hypothetical protein [Paenibacillus sp. ACRSA]
MNLMEYKTLSLDFRRVSSNLLTADADNAFIKLKRFKLFIDSSPIITKIIQTRISKLEFDFRDCFLIDTVQGHHQIIPPVDEDLHIKAQYDYLSYLCSQDIDIRGVAFQFVSKSGKWNDIVREFLDKAFKPLVDFIVDSLGKEIMILGGDRSMGNNITQNIANNYGNVNAAGRDATINTNLKADDIGEIKALIEKLLPTIADTQLTDEEKEFLTDDMETITEQLESSKPKMARLKKAYEGIKKYVGNAKTGITSATLFLSDWNSLMEKVEELIGKS